MQICIIRSLMTEVGKWLPEKRVFLDRKLPRLRS